MKTISDYPLAIGRMLARGPERQARSARRVVAAQYWCAVATALVLFVIGAGAFAVLGWVIFQAP